MQRSTQECNKCKRRISLSNYKRHASTCDGTYFSGPHKSATIVNEHKSPTNWHDIQSDYDNGLSYRDVSKKYKISQLKIANAKKSGLLNTRNISEAMTLFIKNNGPSVMGNDAKERLSNRMSAHNPGGKCKWYEISGTKVQGKWELNFAIYCNHNDIKWRRCKPWKYIIDGKEKRYTPDFYIPDKKLYIEITGRWWGNDKQKMQCVKEQHPEKNILILEKEKFDKLMEGELVW